MYTYNVDDTTPPVIFCPPSAVVECSASTLPNSTNPGMATATDNCDVMPTVTFSDVTVAIPGACAQEYTIIRTWTATDDCANSAMCTQTITVDDSTPPPITCPANLIIDCTESTAPAGMLSFAGNNFVISSLAVGNGAGPASGTVNVSGVGVIASGANVSLQIQLHHTFVSDLGMWLVAPGGQVLELSTNNGSSNNNLNVLFSDAGALNIATAPVTTSTFIPGACPPTGFA